MLISKRDLIVETKQVAEGHLIGASILKENVQLLDKHYIKTGILTPEDRDNILDITGGDIYTKFVADMYAHWKHFGRVDQNMLNYLDDKIHYGLVKYDAKIFPLAGLDIYNANAQIPYQNHPYGIDIMNLFSMIPERIRAVNLLRDFPPLLLRNLRADIRTPRDEYEFKKLIENLNFIKSRMKLIRDNNPSKADIIFAKAFSSQNNTFTKVKEYLENMRSYLSSDTNGLKELKQKIKIAKDSKIVFSNDDIVVVEVGSYEDMRLLGCGSLWCFAQANSENWWGDYAGRGFVYIIFDFSRDMSDPLGMVVHLPDTGEYYDMYNEPTDGVDYDNLIPNHMRQLAMREYVVPKLSLSKLFF